MGCCTAIPSRTPLRYITSCETAWKAKSTPKEAMLLHSQPDWDATGVWVRAGGEHGLLWRILLIRERVTESSAYKSGASAIPERDRHPAELATACWVAIHSRGEHCWKQPVGLCVSFPPTAERPFLLSEVLEKNGQ